jgi:LysR family hca operon transcriptional activator
LREVDVTVSSDYSPDLAEAVAKGKIDLAFFRAEPGFDLAYQTVSKEPLVVLMPSDHPLASKKEIDPKDLEGESFIAMANKARVLRSVIDEYLSQKKVKLVPTQGVDNPAMVMSLVASTRALTLIPKYVESLMPWSVVSRPLAGEPPTIDLMIGYRKNDASPILKFFLDNMRDISELK